MILLGLAPPSPSPALILVPVEGAMGRDSSPDCGPILDSGLSIGGDCGGLGLEPRAGEPFAGPWTV